MRWFAVHSAVTLVLRAAAAGYPCTLCLECVGSVIGDVDLRQWAERQCLRLIQAEDETGIESVVGVVGKKKRR